MSMDSFQKTKDCTSAAEFLDHLQLRNPHWLASDAISSGWAFRGHRKSEWELESRAFRHDTTEFNQIKKQHRKSVETILQETKIEYRQNEYQPDPDLLCEMILQVVAETELVTKFIELADEVGHLIPENSEFRVAGDFDLENTVMALARNYSSTGLPIGMRLYEFYGPQTIEFALAQHHGIPTRLLDWTFSPLIAAFFAAEEAYYHEDVPNYDLAVWAINFAKLRQSDLRVIKPRRAKIAYLHAQEGLFVYDFLANWHFVRNGQWRTFEQIIEQTPQNDENSLLRKITLPASEAKELLRLLAAEHITRAHIMPTFDNVTKTLKTKLQFDTNNYNP